MNVNKSYLKIKYYENKNSVFIHYCFFIVFNNVTKSQVVTNQEAKVYALNFCKELTNNNNLSEQELIQIDFSTKSDYPEVYIFNIKSGGFVILSGDKKAFPILAYSDNSFIPENIDLWHSSFSDWLDLYVKQIQIIRNEDIKPQKQVTEKWKLLENNKKFGIFGAKDVAPLLLTTWNQGCGYNSLCPYDAAGPCSYVYTGCVATAMAQVIRYLEYPSTGTGSQCYTTYNGSS